MIVGTVHSKSVGKTTLAVHLAGWLDMHGYRVAAVDADWQQQCSTWLAETSPQIFTTVIRDPSEIVQAVPKLHDDYEVVIVDGPAGLDDTAGAVLSVSDAVLVPCGPSANEIGPLHMVAETIRAVQAIREQRGEGSNKPGAIVVPVKTHPKTITTKALIKEAAKLGFVNTTNTIPARETYARMFGLPGEKKFLMWQLGRSKIVKQSVAELDALFQEMFPDACAHDPGLFTRMMNTPLRKWNSEARRQEEDVQEQLVVNA